MASRKKPLLIISLASAAVIAAVAIIAVKYCYEMLPPVGGGKANEE